MANLNLREKINIYGGLVMGAALPLVITRYACYDSSNSTGEEFMKWATSAASVVPLEFFGGLAGLVIGAFGARDLRENRIKRAEPQQTVSN